MLYANHSLDENHDRQMSIITEIRSQSTKLLHTPWSLGLPVRGNCGQVNHLSLLFSVGR